jgi:phage head maturation protease
MNDTFYRVAPPAELILREDGGEPVIEGMVVPYGQWSEVDSVIEGHFLERFDTGSLRKTFTESVKRMKGYFEHRRSKMFEGAPIMDIQEAWDEEGGAFFRASLLKGIPEFIVDGIRKGLYGASIGASPVVVERHRPGKSDYNPQGLEERTYKELRAFDISLTPHPHYEAATVMMRSVTDELEMQALFRAGPERFLELLRESQVVEEAEPEHSQPEEPEAPEEPPAPEPEPEPEPEGSRPTQPAIDYFAEETEDQWRL